MTELTSNISRTITEIREIHGMEQQALATLLGVSQRTISN
ncbi:helix-turn-helix domain-containing protein [Mucilaginibacter sp. UYCu711]